MDESEYLTDLFLLSIGIASLFVYALIPVLLIVLFVSLARHIWKREPVMSYRVKYRLTENNEEVVSPWLQKEHYVTFLAGLHHRIDEGKVYSDYRVEEKEEE